MWIILDWEKSRTSFFVRYSDDIGEELWTSDGTPEGTHLVKDIRTNTANTSFYRATWETCDSFLPFYADDGVHGYETWRTDGTEAGTFLLGDVLAGPKSSIHGEVGTWLNDQFWFMADDNDYYRSKMWKTDGTVEGTTIALEINSSTRCEVSGYLKTLGDFVFFNTWNCGPEQGFWRSDGSVEGTTQLGKFFTDAMYNQSDWALSLTQVGDILLFSANDSTSGSRLWAAELDGSNSHLVVDLCPGEDSSSPDHLVGWQGELYFSAYEPTHGRELWKSDGTAEGTQLVKDLEAGPFGSDPGAIIPYNGYLFFPAHTTEDGAGLWRSDGTPEGTVPVFTERTCYWANGMDTWLKSGSFLYFTRNDQLADRRDSGGNHPADS